MSEKSDIIREVIGNPRFTDRVRAICATKAAAILAQATPEASQLAWAKAAVARSFDPWIESVLMLIQANLATTSAAYDATDADYEAVLDAVLAQAIKARAT